MPYKTPNNVDSAMSSAWAKRAATVTPKAATPVVKTPTTATGTRLQAATAKATTPVTSTAKLQPGLSDQLQLNAQNTQARVQDALRLYQNEAAQQQLRNSLATIDRSAMQQYEGISNDYAARGMANSGGFMRANDQALATTNQQKIDAQTAVRDFINQNNLAGVAQTGIKQGQLEDLLTRLLTQFNSNNIGQLML